MNKIVFENLFRESKEDSFIYQGKRLIIGDTLTLADNNVKLMLTFISVEAKWKQGVVLKTKGEFEINEQKILNKIVLWEDTAPKEVQILIKSKDKILHVFNVWDTGDGTVQYGHNGAAMHIEEIDNCRIYNCNDGFPDDDLNDLIFKIEYS